MLLSPISASDRGERFSRAYTRRPIVVFLSDRAAGSVMQKGSSGVGFVARSDRQGSHCRGTEKMRADGDANRHPCGFCDELAH